SSPSWNNKPPGGSTPAAPPVRTTEKEEKKAPPVRTTEKEEKKTSEDTSKAKSEEALQDVEELEEVDEENHGDFYGVSRPASSDKDVDEEDGDLFYGGPRPASSDKKKNLKDEDDNADELQVEDDHDLDPNDEHEYGSFFDPTKSSCEEDHADDAQEDSPPGENNNTSKNAKKNYVVDTKTSTTSRFFQSNATVARDLVFLINEYASL
ncbi:unnamed protein product, partial [Amoebophrya sp. A25]